MTKRRDGDEHAEDDQEWNGDANGRPDHGHPLGRDGVDGQLVDDRDVAAHDVIAELIVGLAADPATLLNVCHRV